VRVAVVAFLFASLVACRGKSTPPSDAAPAAKAEPIKAEPAKAEDPVFLDLTALRDRACACTDAACTRAVQDDFAGFMEKYMDHTMGTEAQADRVSKLAAELGECVERILSGGAR
jgi:hypothetical protein